MLSRDRILIGPREGWENKLSERLAQSKYDAVFSDFNDLNLRSFDFIVPARLKDAKALRDASPDFANKYILPPHEAEKLFADKLRFSELMLDGKYARFVPRPVDLTSHHYPYMIKARHGAAGKNTYIVKNPGDASRYEDHLKSVPFYRENYVPGRLEYATHILINDGEIVYSMTNAYDMGDEWKVKGKIARPVHTQIGLVTSPDFLAIFRDILNTFLFRGTCCIDYKILDKKPMIYEINPRCGHSLMNDFESYLAAYCAAVRRQ